MPKKKTRQKKALPKKKKTEKTQGRHSLHSQGYKWPAKTNTKRIRIPADLIGKMDAACR